MKNHLLAGITCSLMASYVYGGNIIVNGEANLGHKPEFIEVKVNIASQCYPSYERVAQVTNGAAAKIRDIMKAVISEDENSRDQVISLPGSTVRSTKSKYVNNQEVVICENGWHSSNSLILRVANQDVWPQLQLDILEVIDQYNQEDNASDAATTNLFLEQPQPKLYPETLAKLEKEAHKQAIADASEKFYAIARQCELVGCKITNMSQVGRVVSPYLDRLEARDVAAPQEVFEPEFDLIYVRSNWNISWEYTDNGQGFGALKEDD